MGTKVVTNSHAWGDDTTIVPDYNDLGTKADRSSVDSSINILRNNISDEKKERQGSDSVIINDLKKLNTGLSTKADKNIVQEILSESNLSKIKTSIENLLMQHLKIIHETCEKEHAIMQKDVLAFNEFASNANKEIMPQLKPIGDSIQALSQKIDLNILNSSKIKEFNSELDAIQQRINDIERKARTIIEFESNLKISIDNYLSSQINMLVPRIIKQIEDNKKLKRKGFFSRLFSN
jgi:hypothetical protein